MNAPHLHLILNHIPVLGIPFGLILLVLAVWRRSEELKKIALGIFVIVTLAAIPVYLTGEPAEEVIKSYPNVSERLIEEHEETASIALTGAMVLGLGAVTGLLLFRRGKLMPNWFSGSMVAASLIVSGLMAWTANFGGQVRHTEIRSSTIAPSIGDNKDRD